jgi:hypothetical protein
MDCTYLRLYAVAIIDGVPKVGIVPAKLPIDTDIKFTALGESDVFHEFQLGQTPKEIGWREKLPAYAKAHGIEDIDAAKAVFVADLTGTEGKHKVPNDPPPTLLAGPQMP